MTRRPDGAAGHGPDGSAPVSQQTAEAWRGIAAEDKDDISASLSALLRRRGRRLLQDLLRPHRRSVARDPAR